MKIGVGILGASGYTGAELIRLLVAHPHANLLALGSRSHKGQSAKSVFPGMPMLDMTIDDDPATPRAWKERGVEVVFSALPHGAFAERAQAYVDAGLKLIDLSADFRLQNAEEYPARYHLDHPTKTLLPKAVYGLCEWTAPSIRAAQLVANPGCYPTATLLATLPVVAHGLWSGAPMIVNAVSGVSGAGRSPKLGTMLVEAGNSVSPYKVGEDHVHLGEIKQALSSLSGLASDPVVVFNPHLVPMARGILATISVPLACSVRLDDVLELYQLRYGKSPFVNVLKDDALPETRHVRGSNRCDIALRVVAGGRMLLCFAAIDNLVKGAAGQAVQNWNLMQGFGEDIGLPVGAMSCA